MLTHSSRIIGTFDMNGVKFVWLYGFQAFNWQYCVQRPIDGPTLRCRQEIHLQTPLLIKEERTRQQSNAQSLVPPQLI